MASEAEYLSKDLAGLVQHLDLEPETEEGNDEPETNQDVWLSHRSRVIELMVTGGHDCRF